MTTTDLGRLFEAFCATRGYGASDGERAEFEHAFAAAEALDLRRALDAYAVSGERRLVLGGLRAAYARLEAAGPGARALADADRAGAAAWIGRGEPRRLGFVGAGGFAPDVRRLMLRWVGASGAGGAGDEDADLAAALEERLEALGWRRPPEARSDWAAAKERALAALRAAAGPLDRPALLAAVGDGGRAAIGALLHAGTIGTTRGLRYALLDERRAAIQRAAYAGSFAP